MVVASESTSLTMNIHIPNYFEILELCIDPIENKPDTIAKRITECGQKWNSANEYGDGVIYKAWRDGTLPKMKALLEKNAQDFIKHGEEAQKRAKEKAAQYIGLAAVNGTIAEDIFENICKKTQLRESTVSQIAKGMNVTRKKQVTLPTCERLSTPQVTKEASEMLTQATTPVPGIGPFYNLKIALIVVEQANIYACIKGKISDSYDVCFNLIKEWDKNTQIAPYKRTAKTNISNIARAYFTSEGSKKFHDEAWFLKTTSEDILSAFPIFLTGKDNKINPFYYHRLYLALREKGVRNDYAQWLVYDCCCTKHKVDFPWENTTLKCTCGTVNEGTEFRCSNPACRKLIRAINPSNGKILTIKSDARLFKEACEAYECVENARKALQEGNSAIDAAIANIQKLLSKYNTYEPARDLLKELQKAKEALLLNELEAPSIRSVQATGKTLQIGWSKVLYKGQELEELPNATRTPIRYVLRRKANGIPGGPSDGDALNGLMKSPYQDTNATPGVEYGYAVFAMIGEHVLSRNTGMTGMVLPEAQLRISVNSGQAKLTWNRLPAGWSVVLVRKQGGTPSSEADGTRLNAGTGSEFTDTGLVNGELYGWLLVLSKGTYRVVARGTGIPQEPPPALQLHQWSYEHRGEDMHIEWELPYGAEEVRWVVAEEIPGAPGSIQNISALKCTGETDKEAQKTIIRKTSPYGKYIVPIVIKGDSALVCDSRHGGLQHLRLRRSTGRIQLEWIWPEDCHEVLVLYGKKAFAKTPDSLAHTRCTCSRKGTEKTHSIVLANVSDAENYYVSVFMQLSNKQGDNGWSGTRELYSPGTQNTSKLVCRIIRHNGSWALEIKSTQGGIPALDVRYARNVMPLSREDGRKAFDVEATSQATVVLPLPDSAATSGTCIRPFILGMPTHTLVLNRKSLTIE